MFRPIRQRLLISYLVIMGAVLGGFAIAVRVIFEHSLRQQFNAELRALGEGSSKSLEVINGQVVIESDFPVPSLEANNQALEWFDLQGRSIGHQGRYVLSLPFITQQNAQVQAGNPRLQGFTVPVRADDGALMGYVRSSQSLEEFDEALRHLDWGLMSGISIALILSGTGGFFLTRQAMEPIERSFAQLRQFTADASHELRGPLMAIQANAQVALKYGEGMRSGDQEKLSSILLTTRQMTHLTEDLLFLARSDSQPPTDLAIVDLKELLTQIVAVYQPQVENKPLTLKLKVSGSVEGNADQLRRLFANLLDNALRHTASGEISLHSRQSDAQVWIAVQDSGVGIAPADLEKVFDRFWQADRARSSQTSNCGLGLAIAQAIAQKHGGEITVESNVGQGSCFTVQLPCPTDGQGR
ncbi:MAG: HAMP domain-containing histidine kinase [Alkalinema sp. RU_4_3]|nr:HAMP domain-containing histidine kinase [Alkalinema sp. RU_4_3]